MITVLGRLKSVALFVILSRKRKALLGILKKKDKELIL